MSPLLRRTSGKEQTLTAIAFLNALGLHQLPVYTLERTGGAD